MSTIFGGITEINHKIDNLERTIAELTRMLEKRRPSPEKRQASASPPPARKRERERDRERHRSPPPSRRSEVTYSSTEIYIGGWGNMVAKEEVTSWLTGRYGKDCVTDMYVIPSNDWGKITLANSTLQAQVLEDRDDLAQEFGWNSVNITKGIVKGRNKN